MKTKNKYGLLTILFILISNFYYISGTDNYSVENAEFTLRQNEKTERMTLNEFKVAAMHYAESFLSGAEIGDFNMEGFAAADLIPLIDESILKTGEALDNNIIKKFAELLRQGAQIQTSASNLRQSHKRKEIDSENLIEEYKKLFDVHLSYLEVDEWKVLPIIWSGPNAHGVVLILKRNTDTTYELVLANTGTGIEYHKAIRDKNGVTPFLSRVWKKYDNIPKEKLSFWFMEALALISDIAFMSELEKSGNQAEVYFYESLMANLVEYEVEESIDPEIDDRFIRKQVSGSCSYSSILAGLLYKTPNLMYFLRLKLILGQFILSRFLDNSEGNIHLKNILSSAYKPMARYLMKHLASGIASQALEYLNYVNPGVFNDQTLKNGNHEEVTNALKSLEDFEYIKKAASFAIRIHKLLTDIQINLETTKIDEINLLYDSPHNLPYHGFYQRSITFHECDLPDFMKKDAESWYKNSRLIFETGKSQLANNYNGMERTIKTFLDTLEHFASVSQNPLSVDSLMATKVYDFVKAFSPYFNELVSTADAEECAKVLSSIKTIFKFFVYQSIAPMAIEDYAAATQLLLLTWKVALRYDHLNSDALGLKVFRAPISGNHNVFIRGVIDKHGDPPEVSEFRKIRMNLVDSNPTLQTEGSTYFHLDAKTCAAYPGWLFSENDYEAWGLYQSANEELDSGDQERLLDPTYIFPDPGFPVANFKEIMPNLQIFSSNFLAELAAKDTSSWKDCRKI